MSKDQINQDEINQILWQACDTFRGILNSATYMNYLLPMLFLKYISDTWEEKYEEFDKQFKGDKEQLIQTVLNIAHNAAQALTERIAREDATITLRSRIARQVTIAKQRHRLALELHVVDNGPGIPEEIKDRLFSPLVSGRDGGSGLGLNLAQTFVQQHKGLIECDSEPEHTDFKIMIPL